MLGEQSISILNGY